jgi:hypothetical protein
VAWQASNDESETIVRKNTLNKLKARLAMMAFVVVAFAATGLTAAGTANYVALHLGFGTQLNQATLQSASSGMASLIASLAPQTTTRGEN